MTLIIVAIFLVCCILIATEKFTNVNKSAVAIFAGTVGWVPMLMIARCGVSSPSMNTSTA